MANAYEIHYTTTVDTDTELKKFVIAVDEDDCRAYMSDQETSGVVAAGWTLFDLGLVEGTDTAFPLSVTQLTRQSDGRWDETDYA